MNNPEEYVFLLGGRDLEMEEIRKILQSRGITFHDLHLEWGAKLSDYRSFFDNDHIFAGIELVKDMAPPEKYLEIDHHNEKSDLPSSIEQVAALLEITLNRWQLLVAANDKGYIPAMLAMGASDNEVREIREADRRAQGVTEEDEKLAEKTITENLAIEGDIIIIDALTNKFSTITDRLYPFKKLLICRNDQFVFYGTGAGIIADKFSGLINDNQAFSGGGKNGFFGIVKDKLDGQSIEKLILWIKLNIAI
jgi:hypothetical protein